MAGHYLDIEEFLISNSTTHATWRNPAKFSQRASSVKSWGVDVNVLLFGFLVIFVILDIKVVKCNQLKLDIYWSKMSLRSYTLYRIS